MAEVSLDNVEKDATTIAYLKSADQFMDAIGYTEHGFRHADLVANIAKNIMLRLSEDRRKAQLAAIAGYLHDIGNVVSREDHGVSSAFITQDILKNLNMPLDEIALVIGAIGNHEAEHYGVVSDICAALIIADKSDVHRSRVRNPDTLSFDIHDRVNYAAQRSFLKVDEKNKTIALKIQIDTNISQVMEYFEIFLSRMIMCRRSAEFLDCQFSLIINNVKLL